MEVRDLSPKRIWNHFEDLNAVPRPSKKEERVIEFMLNFGKELGLETTQDEIGNVLIKKPATPGMEGRKTIVIQGHLDMVHQKNNDTDFDFLTQGIQSYVDGDWVRAKGTTLGADNGMGVAAAMAILSSKDLEHPAVEALFTVDEETGMTGALELKPGFLSGDILLNMDTEEDNELTIGCAGGLDTTVALAFDEEPIEDYCACHALTVKGLSGGHSGMDIIKGLGNANKILNRILFELAEESKLKLISLDGGGLRNAIPREAKGVFAVPSSFDVKSFVRDLAEVIKSDFKKVEPNMQIELSDANASNSLPAKNSLRLIQAIYAMPNGVWRMSDEIDGLVETSSNLARIELSNGTFNSLSLQRSSVESQKKDLANAVRSSFELIGAKVTQSGDYPGWAPNPEASIIETMSSLYREMFSEEPDVNACHAGLECGLIGKHYPNMEMISYGPTIRGAHSPDERVSISSVQKFWDYTVQILKHIPAK